MHSSKIRTLVLVAVIILALLFLRSAIEDPEPKIKATPSATIAPSLEPTITATRTPSPSPALTIAPTETPTATPIPVTATATLIIAATEAATVTPTAQNTPIPAIVAVTATMTAKQAAIAEYKLILQVAANKYGLDWRVMAEQIWLESRFDSVAIGKLGELGLGQIHPVTWDYLATRIGVDNPNPLNAHHNILAMSLLLSEIKGQCQGYGDYSQECVVFGYASGQGNLARCYDSGAFWQVCASPMLANYIEKLFNGIEE